MLEQYRTSWAVCRYWPFIWPFRTHHTWHNGGGVMRFSAKCVFFIFVGIHKSEEHNSESANNYSGKNTNTGVSWTPLRRQRVKNSTPICWTCCSMKRRWANDASRYKKPFTVTCSQEWFYNIITTTECLQNDKKREISKLEDTLVKFTPLCKWHTADDLKLAIHSSTFLVVLKLVNDVGYNNNTTNFS